MSRGVIAVDRVVVLLAGLLLLGGGTLTVLWQVRRLELPGPSVADGFDTLRSLPEHPLWLWGLGVVGVLSVLVALRSLWVHARRGRIGPVALAGTGTGGRLRVDLSAVAHAAAQTLAAGDPVESAQGTAVVDRGRQVVQLLARTDASVDLDQLQREVDATVADLAVMLNDSPVEVRVLLDVRRGRVDNPRVR